MIFLDNIWHRYSRVRNPTYPKAKHLLITADSGDRNGAWVRLWKVELQKLADEMGMEIAVCHLPPGTSKWNKIEHRLFSFISQNWPGKPLLSHEVIVQLIAAITTKHGLKVRSQLDTNGLPGGSEGFQNGDGFPESSARPISRRVELFPPPAHNPHAPS